MADEPQAAPAGQPNSGAAYPGYAPQSSSYGGTLLRGVQWREAFPFTHLFRAFRVAIHPSKLVLGLVLLLTLYVGGRVLDGVWPARYLAVPQTDTYPGEANAYEAGQRRGVRPDQIAMARAAVRERVESGYADRLLALKLADVTDRDKALVAARSADHFGDVQKAIVKDRDDRVAALAKLRDQAVADAKDDAPRVRRAHDAYAAGTQSAYAATAAELRDAGTVKGVGLFHAFFQYETSQVVGVVQGVIGGNWMGGFFANPGANGVVSSVYNFVAVGPVWLMRHHTLYFLLFAVLFLSVWAVFGGAIARIAAVHVARDEKLSVRGALQFSVGKFLSFVSAPLIPLVIVLVVGLLPLAGGLLASIPVIGPVFNVLLGLLFFIVLAAGFVITLVLLGTVGGFNLMYPTIAVEGSDSFDAISRSFSYVYARPWRLLFYTAVAILYGALCYLFVRLFLLILLTSVHAFVGAGMFKQAPSTAPLWSTMWPGPEQTGTLSYEIDHTALRGDQDVAASLVAFWVYLAVAMLGAFTISFYFSVNTIIYYLMRQEVDATEPDDVYIEQSDDEFAETPAAAMPATKPMTTDPDGGGTAGGAKVFPTTTADPATATDPPTGA